MVCFAVQVTDSRDATSSRAPSRRSPSSGGARVGSHGRSGHSSNVRRVSVDSVLRGTSEIPSGQVRGSHGLPYPHGTPQPTSLRMPPPPPPRPVDPRRVVNQSQLLPSRSSKVSEKLVLIPETDEEDGRWDYQQQQDDEGPLRDDEEESRQSPEEGDDGPAGRLPPRKSYAERLPKNRRAEKFSRVTAYCTADAYRLKNASSFLKNVHGARTKLYDECLYVAYHLPLLAGGEGYRLRSSPALKNPGGKPVLDVEIERSEQRNYHEGYFDEYYRERRHSVEGDDNGGGSGGGKLPGDDGRGGGGGSSGNGSDAEHHHDHGHDHDHDHDHDHHDHDHEHEHDHSHDHSHDHRPDPPPRRPSSAKEHQSVMDMKGVAELFVFSYGVVVFWNFTERQEKDILADLTFAPDKTNPLISGPMKEEDFESEEFHFEYSEKTRSPRVTAALSFRPAQQLIRLCRSTTT